ncbi:DNA-binding protein [candidate division KSB1 bacterium]|nr:MAG: DNA-binding protein [candidate division KSB1 bacterium]
MHMKQQNRDKLLTIEEVAEILRVSTRSVNRYIESRRLKASKIGWWRIKQSDVDRFLEENSNIRKKRR